MSSARKESKAADSGNQGDFFTKAYSELVKDGADQMHAKRLKIDNDHKAECEKLMNRIKALSYTMPAKKSRSGALAQPDRKAQLEKLRALLVSKRDIESRISASIEGLETAYNTTSKELILVLKARAEATSQA